MQKKPERLPKPLRELRHQELSKRIRESGLEIPIVNTFLDEVDARHYIEKPVDIETFISHPNYLGGVTNNGTAIYGVWNRELKEIFLDDEKYIVVFTGAIGIGKTFIACIGIAYVMYRVLCLDNPWKYFTLANAGKMTVSFFNLTKTLSSSRGYQTLQSFLMSSPWFLKHGVILGGVKESYLDIPLFNYALCSPYSKGFGSVGSDVIAALMDEVDSPTESASQKIRVLKAYEATMRRFESRFVKKNMTLARFFLVSSKQDEMSFLETYIEQMRGSNKVHLVDIALWDAKPESSYCGTKFAVKVGDKFTGSAILKPEEVDVQRREGAKIIEVPIEYLGTFERDIIGGLRDIAGITVAGIRKSKLFPSEKFVRECYDKTKFEPVEPMTIEIGLQDSAELIQFLRLSLLRGSKGTPRAIHCDIAFTGDALGLAMSYICGWTKVPRERPDGTFYEQSVPIVETDFVMRIKAREGDRIPQHKVRKLVLDLKASGYNIKRYTSDLRLASEDTLQILKNAGVDADYLSVDKDIKHYLDFQNLVFERRWVCHKNDYLDFELVNLEWDREKNKIDHPDLVKDIQILKDGSIKDYVLKGSKDLADAVCGSVAGALTGIEAPIDGARMAEMVRNINKRDGDEEKDPYWFVNPGKDKDEKVVASSSGDPSEMAKFIGLVKKANR